MKLTNVQTIKDQNGSMQIAKLPLGNFGNTPQLFYSDWVAFNGKEDNYEIRFRLSLHHAERLGLK